MVLLGGDDAVPRTACGRAQPNRSVSHCQPTAETNQVHETNVLYFDKALSLKDVSISSI
jgi:hypothetical protein